MRNRKQWVGLGAVLAVTAWATVLHGGALAAGNKAGSTGGATIEVPGDYATIQAAVNAAQPGDLILVSPGVYHETVDVQVENLTIRGLDRNQVILDGEFEFDNGIRVLGAGGVVLENMTAMNYTINGFFWTGVDGYRGSYLNATRIGYYGLYAFDSVNGQFDHSYASGMTDAGFYIGQCFPCFAVMTDVIAEYNGIGFSGTNASGEIYIINSRFNNNRVGIVPNSGSYELCYPQRDLVIAGNRVYSNNQDDTPAINDAILAMSNGIVIAGGIGDTVVNNRVWDHAKTGIALTPYLERAPADSQPPPEEWDRPCAETVQDPVNTDPPDLNLWNPMNNVVTGNVVTESGVADLAVASVDTDLSTLGNCFAGNEHSSSAPEALETLAPCDGEGSGDWTAGTIDLATWLADLENAPDPPNYETAPTPELEPQENMPDAATAPADPADDIVIDVDVASIAVPDASTSTG
jgi:hypothetical protein